MTQSGASLTPVSASRQENLALLYQGFFTGIVRIQTGRQQISNAQAFRRRMMDALAEVARESVKRNYAAEHTVETDFAIVAFLDETILNSNDPCRGEWIQKPLQEELFGVSVAGELFFTRLEKLLNRQDSPELADMLEVYHLCLLLGFEGRYAVTGKAELHMLMDRVRQRIDRIRNRDAILSPQGFLPNETIVEVTPDALAKTLLRVALISGVVAVFLFLAFTGDLLVLGSQARDLFAQSLVL